MTEYKQNYRVISVEEKEQLNYLLAIGYKEDYHNDDYIMLKRLICVENNLDKIPRDTFYNYPVFINSIAQTIVTLLFGCHILYPVQNEIAL